MRAAKPFGPVSARVTAAIAGAIRQLAKPCSAWADMTGSGNGQAASSTALAPTSRPAGTWLSTVTAVPTPSARPMLDWVHLLPVR